MGVAIFVTRLRGKMWKNPYPTQIGGEWHHSFCNFISLLGWVQKVVVTHPKLFSSSQIMILLNIL